MNVLLIGGTGAISQAVSELAVQRGHTVWLLNRNKSSIPPAPGTRAIIADKNDRAGMRQALAGPRFDVVANFIAYNAEDVQKDVELFAEKTSQYIVISSASAYQKPPNYHVVTESTPVHNPYWEYSRNKIALENAAMRAYRSQGFPVTIVRPSYTYAKTVVPGVLFGMSFHQFDRIRQGKPIIVHGDGQSLWQMTHNEDFAKGFVGLFGNSRALGETFHITSDEVMTWDQIFHTMGRALGHEVKLAHIPVEFISRAAPQACDGLKGDKMYSIVLDNTKIKTVVPDYRASITFFEGMRRCAAWYEKNPQAGVKGAEGGVKTDQLIALWEKALAVAQPLPAL
jgi:nucleoside-diphosphate-sugar epimerase